MNDEKFFLSCFMNYEEYDKVVLTLFSCPEITFLCNLQYKPLVWCDFQNIFFAFQLNICWSNFQNKPGEKVEEARQWAEVDAEIWK